MPATLYLDLVYCLLLEETQDALDRRDELDGILTSRSRPLRETWGRLPHQQRAMARGITAPGSTEAG